MDLNLKKLGRTELVAQLRRCRDMAAGTGGRKPVDMKVEVVRSDGGREVLVSFRIDVVAKFTRTVPSVAALGALMGTNTGPMSYLDVMRSLDRDGVPEEVRIGDSAVGKVFCTGSGGSYTIYLFPVPVNIEEINEFVHEFVSRSCEDARKGMACGSCCAVSCCEILAEADAEARRHFCS